MLAGLTLSAESGRIEIQFFHNQPKAKTEPVIDWLFFAIGVPADRVRPSPSTESLFNG